MQILKLFSDVHRHIYFYFIYFYIIRRQCFLYFNIVILLEDRLHGSLMFLHTLLDVPGMQGSDQSLPEPFLRTVLAERDLEDEVTPPSVTKSRCVYCCYKCWVPPTSSVFPRGNTSPLCAQHSSGPSGSCSLDLGTREADC